MFYKNLPKMLCKIIILVALTLQGLILAQLYKTGLVGPSGSVDPLCGAILGTLMIWVCCVLGIVVTATMPLPED